MNRRQKLVQGQFLNNEEEIIKRLDSIYDQSLKDISGKVKRLDSSIESLQKALADVGDDDIGDLARAALGSKKQFTPKEAKETLQSMLQSKVYQKNYQAALKKQVGDILDKLHENEFKSVSDYLKTCYEDGFVGTMYDLQGQGIPLIMPIDQESMVRAIQTDSKIRQGLYKRLGEDVSILKRKIASEVSRGISTGMSYQQVAQLLGAASKIGYNNSVRIARTEGHRVQCQAGMDACYKAKDKGADVVKQWDATLDGKTRESHSAVDGEIRELDETFSNGLMFPGDPSGGAGEVINCRCALLQRARWALDDKFTKMNNFTKELETFESPEDYNEFKKSFFSKENNAYMRYVSQMERKYGTNDFVTVLTMMTTREYSHYSKLLSNNPLYNKVAQTSKISGKSDILTTTNYADFKTYLVNEYGVSVSPDVKQLDFSAVKESMAGADYILKEFPQAHDMFTALDCNSSAIMSAGYHGNISFNPAYYSDYNYVAERSIAEFCDMTTSVFVNGAHEAGHLLEATLIRMNGGYAGDWNDCTYAKQLVSEALKNAKKQPDGKGKKVAQLIEEVSYYAKTDRSECLAECVADHAVNGDNAALLSKEVWKLLKSKLG